MRRPPNPAISATWIVLAAVALAGCQTARLLAPAPPLRAASAASYAVDVEFDVPLDRGSAEDPTRYMLTPAAGGVAAAISSATLIDTLNGRVVQLLVPDWVSTSPDTTDFDLTSTGVLDVWGGSTGTRTVRFRTGLSYAAPMREWLDSRCTSCHGASRQDGLYRTDTYSALFGGGRNATPNLIAGDPRCLIVTKCGPRHSMFNVANLTYFDYELIRNWVASFNARP